MRRTGRKPGSRNTCTPTDPRNFTGWLDPAVKPRDDRQLVIPAQAGIQKILNTARSMILTEPRATTGHSIPGKIARNTRQIKRRQFLDDWIPRSSRGMTQGASPRRRDENIIAAILYFSRESALF
jgi:hypothetical protein